MDRLKTIKFWRVAVLLALLISLAPVFWMGLYCHSSADDYSYGVQTRAVWVDTHNVIEVLKEVGEKVRTIYLEWQGSYAAVALFALQPAVFGEQFYPLTTFLILGLFLLSVFYFFRKIVKRVFHGDGRIADIVSGVVLLLSVQMLPSPVEGFFWWNGASYYVIFYSLMLIQLANLAVVIWEDKCNRKQFAGCLIWAAVISGGNYISALLTVEVTVFLLIYAFFKKKKVFKKAVVVLFMTIAFFLVNCLAPGNAVRQTAFEAWSPVRAVLYSFHEAYNYMVEWTSPLVIVGMLFLFPFLCRISVKSRLKDIWSLGIVLVLEFSVFASSFTPTLYAYGGVGAGRIQNIRYFLWILTCIAGEFTVICVVRNMLWFSDEEGDDHSIAKGEADLENKEGSLQAAFVKAAYIKELYSKYAVSYFTIVIFFAAFFAGNTILADDTQDLVSVSAAKSLLSGEARQYDREARERIEKLKGKESVVLLEPYSCVPELLLSQDITKDSTDWVNVAVARFYRKEEVRVRE